MIELLTTNPEIINNNGTNPKIAASLCNSGFKPESLRMIKVAENSSSIIIGNTKTQDYSDKYLFLDSSGLINIDCSKLIVSKMIKFDRISQIMVDNADYDTISTSHLDGSTNLPFKFGKAGNANASSISKVSNSICIRGYTPVRKAADAPQGSGHLPHQDDVHNANANADAEGVNAENGAAAMNNNAAENNNANGGGGGDDGGDGGGGGGADGAVATAIAKVMAIVIAVQVIVMLIVLVVAMATRRS